MARILITLLLIIIMFSCFLIACVQTFSMACVRILLKIFFRGCLQFSIATYYWQYNGTSLARKTNIQLKNSIQKFIDFYNIRQVQTNMDKPLSHDDIAAMERQLKQNVEEDRAYWRVNNVKCDAISTAKTYEEFADRVAAAHLQPLEKKDFSKKASPGWNQFATKEKYPQE